MAVLKKYAEFTGRARRTEFWMFFLINLVISLVFGVLSAIPVVGVIFKVASSLYGLAVLIPGIAVAVRRLHDIGKSGAFYLFVLLPVVGWIILLVYWCTDSQPGANTYGDYPK